MQRCLGLHASNRRWNRASNSKWSRAVASWSGEGRKRKGQLPHPEIFRCQKLPENFLIIQKCLSKNATFGRKILILGKLIGKVEILSISNFSSEICSVYRIFLQCLSENGNFLLHLLFLTHDAAGTESSGHRVSDLTGSVPVRSGHESVRQTLCFSRFEF